MDALTLMIAMQQPQMLPILLLLDDKEELNKVTAVDIDTTSVDFTQQIINIPATVTPADADLESAYVIATSKHYSAKLMYNDVDQENVLQLERTVDSDSACEVYIQVDNVNVLTDANGGSDYFTFNYDAGV